MHLCIFKRENVQERKNAKKFRFNLKNANKRLQIPPNIEDKLRISEMKTNVRERKTLRFFYKP